MTYHPTRIEPRLTLPQRQCQTFLASSYNTILYNYKVYMFFTNITSQINEILWLIYPADRRSPQAISFKKINF